MSLEVRLHPLGPPAGLAFGPAWIAAYFAEVDRLDPEALTAWYAEDGRFRFGNAAPVQGREAISAVLRRFYAGIGSMRHEALGVWIDGESGVQEADVTFITHQGRTLTLPAVSILRTQDGLVRDFRIVMDAAPLAEAPHRVGQGEINAA